MQSKSRVFKTIFITFLLNVFTAPFSQATNSFSVDVGALGASHEDFHYDNFFLIKDDPRAALVDLLNFQNKLEAFPLPAVPYSRKEQFGTWINIPKDQLCQNTRSKVLARDSQTDVSYGPGGCVVKAGHWQDPYSDTLFESASAMQIDHLVPLKNAYMTGAHQWDSDKRCLYANYLHNKFHLISVSGTENLKKGDNSPAIYIPPNKKYVCEYLKNWLQVKVIWQLRITPAESKGILQTVESEHCDHAGFTMLTAQLITERNYIEDHVHFCQSPEAINDLVSSF